MKRTLAIVDGGGAAGRLHQDRRGNGHDRRPARNAQERVHDPAHAADRRHPRLRQPQPALGDGARSWETCRSSRWRIWCGTVTTTGRFPSSRRSSRPRPNGGVSKDGLTITWHLRHGVKWSDGAPFDADDVVFSTNAVNNPANNEVGRDGWDLITKIDEPDKYTVVYHLKKPYSGYLPSFFGSAGANPCILPKHILGNLPNINTAPYNAKPIGIGPFRYVEWVPRRSPYARSEPVLLARAAQDQADHLQDRPGSQHAAHPAADRRGRPVDLCSAGLRRPRPCAAEHRVVPRSELSVLARHLQHVAPGAAREGRAPGAAPGHRPYAAAQQGQPRDRDPAGEHDHSRPAPSPSASRGFRTTSPRPTSCWTRRAGSAAPTGFAPRTV